MVAVDPYQSIGRAFLKCFDVVGLVHFLTSVGGYSHRLSKQHGLRIGAIKQGTLSEVATSFGTSTHRVLREQRTHDLHLFRTDPPRNLRHLVCALFDAVHACWATRL